MNQQGHKTDHSYSLPQSVCRIGGASFTDRSPDQHSTYSGIWAQSVIVLLAPSFNYLYIRGQADKGRSSRPTSRERRLYTRAGYSLTPRFKKKPDHWRGAYLSDRESHFMVSVGGPFYSIYFIRPPIPKGTIPSVWRWRRSNVNSLIRRVERGSRFNRIDSHCPIEPLERRRIKQFT